MADDYLVRIGRLIRDARQHRGWTQTQLAEALGTSQSAVNRIERGNQNISLEMIARIGEALDSEIVSLGYAGPMHLRVVGGRRVVRDRPRERGAVRFRLDAKGDLEVGDGVRPVAVDRGGNGRCAGATHDHPPVSTDHGVRLRR